MNNLYHIRFTKMEFVGPDLLLLQKFTDLGLPFSKEDISCRVSRKFFDWIPSIQFRLRFYDFE